MTKFWIIAILLLIISTLVISRLSLAEFKKENSEKMWKQFGLRTRYWQIVILISFVITSLVMLLLKWMNIFTF